jgi:basic amino acid/polyamine antiporter, APA family
MATDTTATPMERSATPSLFLRNATGLVKGWSGFDAFVYAFMSVNLVCLGMFYSLAIFAYVPDGSAIASIVLTGIGMTFMCIAVAGLIAVMPRAGGDYVWQTRIMDGIPGAVIGGAFAFIAVFLVGTAMAIGDVPTYASAAVAAVVGAWLGMKRGGIGFVFSATGWWFILALWAPIYGFIMKIEIAQPLAAVLGWSDAVTFLGSTDGTFVVSIATIVITSLLVALGMAGYARIQRWSFYIGIVALGVMFVLMLISSQDQFKAAFDREAQSLFGVTGGYDATIAQGAEQTANTTPTDLGPLTFGGGTLLLIPFMLFFLLYPNWGATLYGEVRGAGDFRKVLNGMLGGLWATVGLAVIFLLLVSKTFGWEFFNAANVTYVNWAYLYVQDPTVVGGIWAYPPLLAAFLIDSHIIQAIILIAFGFWWLGWTGTLFLSSTRMIFAAAFDRVLPEWAARVSDRGVPWAALALIMIPSVVLSWFYAYNPDFYGLTLDATLVIAVTFFGTSIAATILPWWKKDLYDASPIARFKFLGLPLIAVAGALSTIFLGWVLYTWLTNALYGIGVGNVESIKFLGFLYGAAAVLYIVARLWRRAQGVDLDAIHAAIPAE